jgi:gliding motility-associated protein GldE
MIAPEPPSFLPLLEAFPHHFNLSGTITGALILLLLLFLSGLASGTESAFFSLSPQDKEELKNEESKAARTAIHLLEHPKELLATLLILNNFVNVGIVILSSYLLNQLYPETSENEVIRFMVEVIGITFTILLIGEVIPKIWSSKNALRMTKLMSIPINTLRALPPLSWLKRLLVNGTNFIQRKTTKKGMTITSNDLEQALALTREHSTSDEEHKILEGIVRFGNTEVCQIMKSRLDVVAIEQSKSFTELYDIILEAGYSRIPVFEETFDNVTGVLYIKDLLPFLGETEEFDWKKLVRKPFFVPENKKIDDLLKEFQHKKMHMAIVVDEYGGANGIITLEDVLEEIVGDITDEFDELDIVYSKLNDYTFVFEGKTSLVDFYKVTDTDSKPFEQVKGDAETLGGFITEQAGKILKNNEFIEIGGVKLIVESSDKRRVKMIKTILPYE